MFFTVAKSGRNGYNLGMSIQNYNITVFGDSVSKGVTTDDGLATVKTNAINCVEQHFGVTITNKSVFGMTLKKFVDKQTFKKFVDGADKSVNNLVALAIGGNDADFDWRAVNENPTGFHLQNTPLKQFGELLTDTINLFKQNGVRVVLTTLPPINPYRYIDNRIVGLATKENVMTFLKGDVLNMYRDHEMYSDEIMRVALVTDTPLIDLRRELLPIKDYNDYLCHDGIHPNQKGQLAIGKVIIDIIQQNKILNY